MDTVSGSTYLYTIKHKVMPIIYIGITNNIKSRFADHKRESSNTKLRAYIKELGVDNFVFSSECSGTRSEIEELEELAILEAKSSSRLIVCNVVDGSVFTGGSTQQGTTHWNVRFSEQDIADIREIYSQGGISQKEIGEIYGCSNKVISKITSGARWASSEGAISKNITANKVANRRKLSDTQVIEVRNLAYKEYLEQGSINIPDIAELYGIARNSMRYILTGRSYPSIPGPILKKDYYPEWGRNHGE